LPGGTVEDEGSGRARSPGRIPRSDHYARFILIAAGRLNEVQLGSGRVGALCVDKAHSPGAVDDLRHRAAAYGPELGGPRYVSARRLVATPLPSAQVTKLSPRNTPTRDHSVGG
jgi:hypothetical protein